MYRGEERRFALVCARFNRPIVERLCCAAIDALHAEGVAEDAITTVWVPGAFEIPLVAKRLAQSGSFSAVICLGCVIRGETAHFEYVASQVAAGIMHASLMSGLPIIFGVLTTEDEAQAERRSGIGGKNLGSDFALAALEMAHLIEILPPA